MAKEITMIRLRPNRRYEVGRVKRSPEIPLLLQTKNGGWLDDMRHASICSQYRYPYYDNPDEIAYDEIEETEPSFWAWTPKETVFTLDGQSEILSTDTTLRDSDLDERSLQDNQRNRLQAALSQFAIAAIEKKEASKSKNDFILTVLTFALLLAVMVLAIVFLPNILDRAGDLTGSITIPGI